MSIILCSCLFWSCVAGRWYEVVYISTLSQWLDFPPASRSNVLSTNYLVSSTSKSSFPIAVYNTSSDIVTVTSQGFIYLSSYTALPQQGVSGYVSPLMAHFVPHKTGEEEPTSHKSEEGDRSILILSSAKVLAVEWRNMRVSEKRGKFTFQCQLYPDGRIVMLYKTIPFPITQLSHSLHPVELGIRSAKPPKQLGKLPKTVHSLDIDTTRIKSGTSVVITPIHHADKDSTTEGNDIHHSGASPLLVLLLVILAATIPMLTISMVIFYKTFLVKDNKRKMSEILPF